MATSCDFSETNSRITVLQAERFIRQLHSASNLLKIAGFFYRIGPQPSQYMREQLFY